jgi:GNAT superfamily N-acetyltransferase
MVFARRKMTSLYGQYILEKEGTQILEKDYGYITYKIIEKEIHIFDLFIVKEERNKNLGFILCKELESVAKECGCNYAMATIAMGTKGQTEALKFHLKYGLQLISASKDYIVLGKEI